jgi:uncharacterized protein YjlB
MHLKSIATRLESTSYVSIPMNRRRLIASLAIAGAAMGTRASAGSPEPELLHLSRNGWMPNNEALPVLLYRNAFPSRQEFQPSQDMASAMETAFERNGWPPQWRNGVYDFHHYHSTAHEVLGFARGRGRIVLGGEGGHELHLNTGDVAVLPAGTGHCRLEASADFLVIGAYPKDETWDICRTAPDAATLARMSKVAFPASDPISGPGGPLTQHWHML